MLGPSAFSQIPLTPAEVFRRGWCRIASDSCHSLCCDKTTMTLGGGPTSGKEGHFRWRLGRAALGRLRSILYRVEIGSSGAAVDARPKRG
jgi:hypothetical protein